MSQKEGMEEELNVLQDKLKSEMRKKSLLVLIYHYLLEQGYVAAAVALDRDSNGVMRKFELCDNIYLEMVLLEFENNYFVKFQKYPKLIKRNVESGERIQAKSGPFKNSVAAVKPQPKTTQTSSLLPENTGKKKPSGENDTSVAKNSSDFGLNIFSVKNSSGVEPIKKEWMLKPLSGFSTLSDEMQELAELINREVYLHSPNVKWDDIIGLEDAKRLVKEAVVYPIKYPQLFTGILSPWRGLLLYGPPGTGKTMLAKAVATECETTFFNISASSIISKWRGTSEKMVRVLFELARYHAPSTIFLDELESVMGQRGTRLGEHEGSRRMKTELLVQMDGLANSADVVFVLAASNLPWELDQGMLRRLEKRILVNFPSSPARQAMIHHWLPPLSSVGGVELRTELEYKTLAEMTEGYSGSDIRVACKEAAMRPVRKVFDALESHQSGHLSMSAIRLDSVTMADFTEVIAQTKPSVQNLKDRYTAWEQQYKSV